MQMSSKSSQKPNTLRDEVAEMKSDIELILQRQTRAEEDVKEILECLKGRGKETGIVSAVIENSRLTKKHDEELYGNGKEGLVSRFRQIERVWSTNTRIALAFVVAVVSAIGGGIGAWVATLLVGSRP
jgi:hypothetical protein